MFRYECEIFVLLILMLKVCSIKPQTITPNTEAQIHAKTLQQETNNTTVSSYFRQDPYGPNTYAFGYEIDDRNTHNVQFRDERRYLNGTIFGSYGYVRPDGRITLTRYMADKEHGFHSQTDLFQPGEEQKLAAARWPLFVSDAKFSNATHNQQHQEHMLSDGFVQAVKDQHNIESSNKDIKNNIDSHHDPDHDNVVQAVKAQHNIDLSNKDTKNHMDLHHDPTIADIVNGEIPLSLIGDNKNSVVGFKTVNKFIPQDFPIVPFELPTHLDHTSNAPAEDEAATHIKYDKAKQNNAEKTIPSEALKTHAEIINEQMHQTATGHSSEKADQHERMLENRGKHLENHARQNNLEEIPPKPLPDSDSEQHANATWYHKVINEARKEFLQNLPSLE